jgi:copper homeostasis protein CutC
MLEICVEDAAGIDAAIAGGGDRIELCSALALGGLTPSGSLIRYAAAAPLPVHLLARPRDGNFVYSARDAALIADDIRAVAQAGLSGVVIGASLPSSALDAERLAAWVALAQDLGAERGRPLSLTLHRAFDLCPDLPAALETAIDLGFDRILTSAGQPRAIDALAMFERLVRQADGRIILLAGSGVDAITAPAILATGVPEIHASCRSPAGSASEAEQRFGFQAGPTLRTDVAKIAALRALLDRR